MKNLNIFQIKLMMGTYDYNIIEYQKFSVKNYNNWLNTIDKNKRF